MSTSKHTHNQENNSPDHDNEPHTHNHGNGSYTHTHSHSHGNEHHDHGHTHTHTHTKAVLNRLSRAIGHLTSVRGMVEQGRDCSEVLIQLAAVRSAIEKTCEVILKDHLENCIVDAINTGDMEALKKLNKAVEMLLK